MPTPIGLKIEPEPANTVFPLPSPFWQARNSCGSQALARAFRLWRSGGMSIRLPNFTDIEDAARRIAPWAVATPLLESPALNQRIGARVFLKAEPFQRTGSFKFRGACNRIQLIPEAERFRGVVAFSSGNHAQGVAAAAMLFDLPATIVMPSDAPRAKIEGTRSYGATVITYARKREDREA